MGAPAARLSVLTSAEGSRVCLPRRPRFPGRSRFKARQGLSYPPVSGRRISSISRGSWARTGGGGGGKEGVCIRDGGSDERLPIPALRSGQSGSSAWVLLVTLGRTTPPHPRCDLCGAGCTVPAHPRRSGALLPPESERGTREKRSAPGAGDPAAGARGPLKRPGAPLPWNNRARGSHKRAGGLCPLDPAAERADTRGRLPWGPFPPGQERSLRPAAA